MDINSLEKLAKEELINIIKSLNKQYVINFDNPDFESVDFRTVVEAVYDIIFVIDKERKIVYMNRAWKKAFPSRDSDPGKLYTDYLHEIELERGNFVVNSVLQEGTVYENELLKIYESGKPAYFVTTFSPVSSKNKEIVGLIGVMRNYTEQYMTQKKLKENSNILEEKVKEQIKQAEELKNLRDFNEEIINNSPIGIFMADPSGVVISENPVLCELMGREPNTLTGVNILKYEGFIEAGLAEIFERALFQKKTVKVNEVKYTPISKHKDLVVNVTLDPILNRQGAVERILLMIEDVTEHVKFRGKINRSEKMTALGLLASGVASELKSHINNMAMDLNFVDSNVDEHSPVSEYVDSLQTELERIKNISEQLLSLAIIDERDKDICEINKIINGHPLDVLINRLRKEGHEVDVILPGESPEILATPNQIQQLLLQFLENAEDAISDVGKIEIKVDSVKSGSDLFAVLTISDDGVGIPDENIKKIFQPFFTTKGKKGTGLGLMIAMNILNNLGGTIGVKTKPGEGTSIRIVLPQIKK